MISCKLLGKQKNKVHILNMHAKDSGNKQNKRKRSEETRKGLVTG